MKHGQSVYVPLAPLSVFFSGFKHSEPDCKLAEAQSRSKNTVAEALPVQPAITQAVTSIAKDRDVNDNGLNILPKCKDDCFVSKKIIRCGHICKNVQINEDGEYILFPSQCWHYGYFNEEFNKIFITAQLFTRPTINEETECFYAPSLKVKKNSLPDSWGVRLGST